MQMNVFGAAVALFLSGLAVALPAVAAEPASPAPLVIVADDERTLDDGPLGHLDALAYGGGFALDNTILLVNGNEVRRLAAAMPLAPVMQSYLQRGLTIYACADAAATQRYVDKLPLLAGVRVLSAANLPKGAPLGLSDRCQPGTIPTTR